MKDVETKGEPLSLRARKFMISGGQAWQPDPNHDSKAFRKEYFFFYGTLMDPNTLAKVLGMPTGTRSQLYPAKIVGYSCKLWGPYPAVVDSPLPGSIVNGMAYEVHSPEEVERLRAYETDKYRPAGCMIKFQNGTQVIGKVFKWNGSECELKEGVFDLKDWQMRNMEENLRN